MRNRRPRVWSGRHNKWVFARFTRRCPVCGDTWGGAYDGGYTKGGPYDPKLANPPEGVCPACTPIDTDPDTFFKHIGGAKE